MTTMGAEEHVLISLHQNKEALPITLLQSCSLTEEFKLSGMVQGFVSFFLWDNDTNDCGHKKLK